MLHPLGRSLPRLVMLAVLVAGCATEQALGDGVVRDSAGVRLVEAGGGDRFLDWKVERLYTLPLADSGVDAQPFEVAADAKRGRVYVLDSAERRLLVFDRDGALEAVRGRGGRGPAELSIPAAVHVDTAGVAVVLDAGESRVARWSAEGEWLGTRPFTESYWGPGFAVVAGGLAFVRSVPDPGDPLRMGQELIRTGDGGTQRVASLDQSLTMLDLPCIRMPVPRLLTPSLQWTSRGDELLVVGWPDYRIDVYGEPGLVPA